MRGNVIIDARNLELKELFMKLKEILESELGKDVFIEILINTFTDIKKIKSFVSMSGCQTDAEKKDGYYIVRVTGTPCCV